MVNRFVMQLRELGITLSDNQLFQFEQYYQELVEWNSKLNLTSILDKDEVYQKHFYDSLSLIKAVKINQQTLLDVGSGAGFPSIPLKIVFPELKITILDALQKRILFLQHLCHKLDLDIELIHGRAEEFDKREGYDLVTARAVANLQMLTELCIPFVKIGGYFLAMKGPKYEQELHDSMHAVKILKGTVEKVITYRIDDFDRTIIKIKKVSNTPLKYPRRFNKIKSKPL